MINLWTFRNYRFNFYGATGEGRFEGIVGVEKKSKCKKCKLKAKRINTKRKIREFVKEISRKILLVKYLCLKYLKYFIKKKKNLNSLVKLRYIFLYKSLLMLYKSLIDVKKRKILLEKLPMKNP